MYLDEDGKKDVLFGQSSAVLRKRVKSRCFLNYSIQLEKLDVGGRVGVRRC